MLAKPGHGQPGPTTRPEPGPKNPGRAGLGIRDGLGPQIPAREIVRAGLGLHFSSISGRAFGLRAGLARITAEKCHSGRAFGLLFGLRARLGLRKREKPGLRARLGPAF